MVRETYAEAGVKQKGTMKLMAIRIGLILLLFISMMVSQLASFLYILPALVLVGVIYIFPKLNLEYEYIYVDGQIDFDRIMGGAKRKTVLRIDLENVELVAPSDSDELLAYAHKEDIVTKIYSSLLPDSKTWSLFTAIEGKYTKVIFEPSEKMLECMRWKAPRKVKG